VGDEPYQASVMKITGNFFIVSCVETIAEGMTLAEKNGISRCAEAGTSQGQASCCLLTSSSRSKQLQFCCFLVKFLCVVLFFGQVFVCRVCSAKQTALLQTYVVNHTVH